MKGIFLVFHGFAEHNGISKKIFYQCEALGRCGAEMELCYLDIDGSGRQRRMLGAAVLEDYGTGIGAKIKKRVSYGKLLEYIRKANVDFVYVRSDHNASPVLINLFRRIKKSGVRIVMEIPTYPYDPEYAQSPWRRKARLLVDKCFRNRMARYMDRIVTFTDLDEIFGVRTICISNGIDFSAVKMKEKVNDTSKRLDLVGVAQIHFWHGFDRVIEGLASYYCAGDNRREVVFNIVGEGVPAEVEKLKRMTSERGLDKYVFFHGALSGKELDYIFERCDMGVASLGRHRNGITKIKTLKNREYAARGIPFVYSETDDDFDGMPYVMKVPADETPLDICAVVRFYDSLEMSPQQIRSTIENSLSWDRQMEKVLSEIKG